MSSIRTLLQRGAERLAMGPGDGVLDSQVLLAHALGCERAWLFARPEHLPEPGQVAAFEALLEQRRRGRPIAHLVGVREFWSLRLAVSPDTLIPRPETEHLVEVALGLDLPAEARVLDLGTGSGAVALALASERPGWRLTALDCSPGALAIASANGESLRLRSIRWLHSDWYDALPAHATFDLIVANPPYVARDDPHLACGDVRFEPREALVSGRDGLDAIRRILAGAPAHLRSGGWLWFEHGHTQGEAVVALLHGAGFERVAARPDLAGHTRNTGGRRP